MGLLRAAFRDVHGPSLHGFALLLTLGDRAEAARLAADALSDGVRRAAALRHPERAAAWLRHRVIRAYRGRSRRDAPVEERRAALAAIGVEDAAFDALAALSVADRAALVAGEIERLDPMDLEVVLRATASDVRRRVSRARMRFFEQMMLAAPALPEHRGPLRERVAAIADRTLASPSGGLSW